jgi:hypothetical protein
MEIVGRGVNLDDRTFWRAIAQLPHGLSVEAITELSKPHELLAPFTSLHHYDDVTVNVQGGLFSVLDAFHFFLLSFTPTWRKK